MSNNEVLVSCENIGKKFCRDLKKSLWYGVKDSLSDIFHRHDSSPVMVANQQKVDTSKDLRPGEFWANRDIQFEVKRGECLGLIGHNGAGKTTLLKMLNGLIKPDCGRIKIKGRLGAMIALGAGFNPVLTARENIFVNGSILGLSNRQISDRFDAIVDFAELHEFVDAPVRTFSSGMQVRLGFAVAVILIKPDVLLLDEVLAVGDAGFRSKCYNSVIEMASRSAVILVSHTMPQIARLSTKVIALRKGIVELNTTNVGDGINQYFSHVPLSKSQPSDESIVGIRELSVTDGQSTGTGGSLTLVSRSPALFLLKLYASRPIPEALLMLSFFDCEQKCVARSDSYCTGVLPGANDTYVQFENLPLSPSAYELHLIIADVSDTRNRPIHLVRYDPFCRLKVNGGQSDHTSTCPIMLDSTSYIGR